MRTEHLGIRLLASERVRLEAAAGRAKFKDTSAWARGLLLAAASGNTVPTLNKDAMAEIARLRRDLNSGIGANLNQAMLHANQIAKAGGVPDAVMLADRVNEAEVALKEIQVRLRTLLGPGGRP